MTAAPQATWGGAWSHVLVTTYRERLWPSLWGFLLGLLIVPAVILVFAPINMKVGILLGIALYAGYVAVLVWASPVIEVSEQQLRVGSARVPAVFLGAATPNATREAARMAAGPKLDARAWLCLRGWVPTSVRVDIDDPSDPVPYWLFSSRDPERVAAAVAEARKLAHAGGAKR
ncbi:hypothetical protein USB125703_01732 [Pseudoclavibacter triregionum]|nr:hypothetical protein USB125703_01732 [Pseudoclavibacter triregionum]